MAPIARRCVPFTPSTASSRASVALVTAAGVHRRDQPRFNIADELGDLTFRVIGADAAAEDLMVTHHHYDHADADRDVNVVFPIDALRELVAERVVGRVAPEHVGFMGYTMQLRKMYEETAPAIAEHVEQQVRPDVVVLTGG
jgi:D-proline reductase (dithiol) PrdB